MPGGSACVFDNYVTVNETEIKYHSVHEWILRDGVPQVWMLYAGSSSNSADRVRLMAKTIDCANDRTREQRQ